MFESTLFRSLGASIITGSLSEGLKMTLIYNNVSIEKVLIIGSLFSYTIVYIVQR